MQKEYAPHRVTVWLPSIPARRHRCEECDAVFECHLCTINAGHELHGDVILSAECNTESKFFICEECAVKMSAQIVMIHGLDQGHYRHSVYEYLDGTKILTGTSRASLMRSLRHILAHDLVVYSLSGCCILQTDKMIQRLGDNSGHSWKTNDFIFG